MSRGMSGSRYRPRVTRSILLNYSMRARREGGRATSLTCDESPMVTIFAEQVELAAEVAVLNGYSRACCSARSIRSRRA